MRSFFFLTRSPTRQHQQPTRKHMVGWRGCACGWKARNGYVGRRKVCIQKQRSQDNFIGGENTNLETKLMSLLSIFVAELRKFIETQIDRVTGACGGWEVGEKWQFQMRERWISPSPTMVDVSKRTQMPIWEKKNLMPVWEKKILEWDWWSYCEGCVIMMFE